MLAHGSVLEAWGPEKGMKGGQSVIRVLNNMICRVELQTGTLGFTEKNSFFAF